MLFEGWACKSCFKEQKMLYRQSKSDRLINTGKSPEVPYGNMDDRSRGGSTPAYAENLYDGGFGSETLHRFDNRPFYRRSE